jgi:hypothetical protein
LERKDRSYYLIIGKKGIELPTNSRFFHKKRAIVEFIEDLRAKNRGFSEIRS